MVDLALIIVNSKYKSKDLDDLPEVTEDGVMMSEILTSHDYEIKLYQDVEDIGEILEKFQRNVAGREIGRLHFHFAGYGVHNTKIHLKPDELERMRGGRQSDTKTTKTPDVGECMVGTTGELYSVHDLKKKLLDQAPNKITITLDCCRQELRGPDTRLKAVKFRQRHVLEIAEQERIAVISNSWNLHAIDSNGSLTRELHEVTDAGKTPILLLEIAKKVNASWKEKGLQQRSKIDLLENGVNWVDYMWPSDKTHSESKKLMDLLDSLALDGEIQCDGAPKSSRASAYKQIKVQQTPTLSLKQGPYLICLILL